MFLSVYLWCKAENKSWQAAAGHLNWGKGRGVGWGGGDWSSLSPRQPPHKVNIYPICKLQRQIKGQKWETSPAESPPKFDVKQYWNELARQRGSVMEGGIKKGGGGAEGAEQSSILAESSPFFSPSARRANWNVALWKTRWKAAALVFSMIACRSGRY